MRKPVQERVAQLIEFSVRDGHALAQSLRVVEQNFPEAMLADRVYELEVRSLDANELAKLTLMLINNNMAVERISHQVNCVSHVRIWAMDEESACKRQRAVVISKLTDFRFVDGWQWRSDDPRDLIFELPRRLADERTWAVGAYYGLAEGGPHGIWNHGTLVVSFDARDSVSVSEVALYCRNGKTVLKMLEGQSFGDDSVVPPAVLF